MQAFQLGLGQWSRCRPRKWKQKVQDASSAAKTARLTELVASGLQDGSSREDAAYLQSVTSSGQVGSWAKLVPSFGARVNYRRLRLGLLEGTAKMVARRAPGSTEAICKTVGARAFECPMCPGVEETGSHVYQHVWATACAKAASAVGGTPAAAEWSALGQAGQKAHLLSSEGRFPLEVESRLRGVATKALVDGFHEVDVRLNLGHAVLREAIPAEVQQSAAIKEAAKAAAKVAVAQGAAPSGQAPQGSLWTHVSLAPAHGGQGLQQASQACSPHSAHQEHAGPIDGVPPARKAGPQPKAQGTGPSVVASKAEKKKKPQMKNVSSSVPHT